MKKKEIKLWILKDLRCFEFLKISSRKRFAGNDGNPGGQWLEQIQAG